MTTDNVSDPIKRTFQTSYFRIFALALVLGPPYVIGMVAAARHFLTPADVEWLRAALLSILGLVTTFSGGATLQGGLSKTKGKIAAQLAAQAVSRIAPALPPVGAEIVGKYLQSPVDTNTSALAPYLPIADFDDSVPPGPALPSE